jgi:hypothetical protein
MNASKDGLARQHEMHTAAILRAFSSSVAACPFLSKAITTMAVPRASPEA